MTNFDRMTEEQREEESVRAAIRNRQRELQQRKDQATKEYLNGQMEGDEHQSYPLDTCM